MGKKRTHLQGRRGEAFVKLIRGVPQDKILCLSIDVHKYFHRATIVNGYYEVLVPSFQVDIFRSGFGRLCRVVDETVARTGAQVLFIGMEPTGHYFENLARHLRQRYPHVRLVNGYAVKENRNQRMLRSQKTEDIDLCSIAELILRNECFPYQPLDGDYLRLQEWARFRLAKVKMRTSLKNQIIGHVDRVFPGLVRPQKAGWGDHPALFGDFWANETAQHLVRLCPSARQLAAMQPADLVEMYHARGWRMGAKTSERIIRFARGVLLPDAEVVEARLPLLQADLLLLDAVEQAIGEAEGQIQHYLARTKGQILTEIKGIGVLHAAGYVAGIGNPDHYEHAGQTFKRSGLISGRNDTGIRQRHGKDEKITKEGDCYLRSALIQMTRSLCQWQPDFRDYRQGLQKRGKHQGVATVATARRINGILFALMRDQAHYEPRARGGHGGAKRTATDMDSCEACASKTEFIGCRSPVRET